MATKALPARRERAWISRAATSLPEPAGPVISTRLLVGAILSISWRSCVMAEELPTSSPSSPALSFSSWTSRLQPRRFQRALHHMQQPVGLERLFDEVVGALLDRGDGGLDGAVAGDHHHRQVGLLALDHVEHLDAVQLGALQPDVEHHQLRPAGADRGQRGFAIARDAGGIALVVQDARDQVADVFLVVDDQDFRRDQRSVLAHLPASFSRRRLSGLLREREGQGDLRALAALARRPGRFRRHGLP